MTEKYRYTQMSDGDYIDYDELERIREDRLKPWYKARDYPENRFERAPLLWTAAIIIWLLFALYPAVHILVMQ